MKEFCQTEGIWQNPLAMVQRGETLWVRLPAMDKFNQQSGDEMTILRIKRTMPFVKQCTFIIDVGFGELERCEAESQFGFYVGDERFVKMISLCKYHTIYQESLWRGEKQ